MAPEAKAGTARSAAFFDLDRTLLSGASGPAISAALRTAGLMGDRGLPGQDFLFQAFNIFGENRPAMMLTRQAASLAANWSREKAQQAGTLAADALEQLVQPYAWSVIDEHRQAGRLIVLATTTPYDLVKPLADRLGFDAVIATRYGERDGVYNGTIDGEFVWGHGKYRAVQEWADEANVRPRRELRLLRQLLRRAAAQRGRPSGGGQPRSADAPAGAGTAMAHALPRRSARACPGWPASSRSSC